MKKLNSEWRFILHMVILVAMFLFVRHMFMVNTEHEVESAYEAGYASAMEDVVNMYAIVETKEVDFITPVRKYTDELKNRIEELEYQLDSVGDNAYEAGYSVGFDEGYASRNQIELIDEWFSGIKIAGVTEEDGIGTIKIVDQGDNLWVITYNVN